ncbi:hypothetical protein BJX70DRAFT_363527 [Aspergillus crustosus]
MRLRLTKNPGQRAPPGLQNTDPATPQREDPLFTWRAHASVVLRGRLFGSERQSLWFEGRR